jgi:hypothetical protein
VRERLASEVLVSLFQPNTGLGCCAGSLEMWLRNTCNLWALRKTDHPYGMVGLIQPVQGLKRERLRSLKEKEFCLQMPHRTPASVPSLLLGLRLAEPTLHEPFQETAHMGVHDFCLCTSSWSCFENLTAMAWAEPVCEVMGFYLLLTKAMLRNRANWNLRKINENTQVKGI